MAAEAGGIHDSSRRRQYYVVQDGLWKGLDPERQKIPNMNIRHSAPQMRHLRYILAERVHRLVCTCLPIWGGCEHTAIVLYGPVL